MSPNPSFDATPVARVEVVTLTVFTSGTSTPTSQSSGGGSSSVPIAAIIGGAAGGVILAVLAVLVWKYWGVLIKRGERKRRKEAQDILTVRENTRRNASSGFKPQSQYRPMLALNPDHRRVTFLTRGPTSSRKKQQKQQRDPSPVPVVPAAPEEKYGQGEGEDLTPALAPAAPAAEEETRQPLLGLSPLPHGTPLGSQLTGENPPEDVRTEFPPPTPAPTATTTPDTAPAAHAPEPPVPVRRVRSRSPSRRPSGSSSTHWHGHAAPRGANLPPPVPALPPVSTVVPPPLPVGAAPPTPPGAPPATTPSAPSWVPTTTAPAVRSPLHRHNSVLPASPDRPVIMPRAKNAPLLAPSASRSSSQQLASPASSRPHVPSFTSSASQYSGTSGEPPVRRGFLNALRHKAAPPGAANARRTSTYSSASAYSND